MLEVDLELSNRIRVSKTLRVNMHREERKLSVPIYFRIGKLKRCIFLCLFFRISVSD